MLAFLIAFYRRPDVTAVTMRHYRRMADQDKSLVLVAVGSEGIVSRRLAEGHGWEYVEAPNSPLSNKLAAGVNHVRKLDPDEGLIAMGDDDLVTKPWITQCRHAPTMMGLRDMYRVELNTWEGLHWRGYRGRREGESVGAHRYFPHMVLKELRWQLWPRGLESNLDGNLYRRLGITNPAKSNRVRVLSMKEAGCAAVGLSSSTNLTPWRLVVPGSTAMTPEQILAEFPPETRADVLALRR